MDQVSRSGSSTGSLEFFLGASDEVHRYISRLTGGDEQLTEDILQDTFISLMRHLRSGEATEMTIGWLMVAARHRLVDHVRSRQREQARIERQAIGQELTTPPIEVESVSADRARWMLAQLPLPERVALAMHTVDGLSVSEVAIELGRSVEATTSLLARARRRLRSLVSEESR